jgi:hypothetical protein
MYTVHTEYEFVPGNCLFDSLAHGLVMHGWRGTGMKLREIVLDCIRDGGEKVDAAVEHWTALSMLDEYSFVRCVENEARPLSEKARAKLAKTMQVCAKYYGDDFSMRVLANKLNIRITVLRDGSAAFMQPEATSPTHTLLVALKDVHYTPISFNGHYIVDTIGKPLKL